MLPLFATLLFALIGIGALVIDGGLALAEQARLETAAEMMVSELAYVDTLPNTALPPACVVGNVRQPRCVEQTYLAPILEPLGVEFASGAGGAATWERVDRSLDGEDVDSRGARLGALANPGSLSTDGVRLARSSPLLFGWAAIAPRTRGGTRPDFPEVQAARAAEGLSPDLAGSGLRANGFSLQAEAAIDTAGGARAMHVGSRVAFPGGETGGLVGVAWLLEDLRDADRFERRWLLGVDDPPARLQQVGGRLEDTAGTIVACLFDASSGRAHVGQEVGGPYAGVLAADFFATAYVPVIDELDCDEASEIVGFVELGILIDGATSPGYVAVGSARPARRNASAFPPVDPTQALATANTWRAHGEALDAAFRLSPAAGGVDLALRVPRVVSDPYAERLGRGMSAR